MQRSDFLWIEALKRGRHPLGILAGPDNSDSPNLDLLRAVAVLCVFSSHVAATVGYSGIGSLGRFGVVLFFVHTSFVLMASLDRSNGNAVSFAIRRFFRIYPLAVVCILAVPLFHIPVGPGMTYSWIGIKYFLANLALAQNLVYAPSIIGPLWSLPLEVEMYFFLPALYLIARRNVRAAVLLWVASFATALIIPKISGRLDVFSYAPCFAAGILGFTVARTYGGKRLPGLTWILVILGSILLFEPFDDIPLTSKLPLAWALALAVGLAIPFTREIKWPGLHRVTHLIARYSYGIYLTHVIILWVAADAMKTSPLAFRVAVLLAGLVGLPVLLFHLIENPMIRLGRSLSRRHVENATADAGLQRRIA